MSQIENPFQHRTKTQAISAYLDQLARQLGPDAKLPTMQELSKQLGVSVMTLNRALSELEAQGIIYRRQGSGTYVASRTGSKQKTIGLVYDRDIFSPGASPFGGLIVEEARRRAEAGQEAFSFYLAVPGATGAPVHADLQDAVQTRRLHGVLFVGESNPHALQWLSAQVPTVALAYTPIAPFRVQIDHASGVATGVRELARKGCRDIGLWIPHGVGIGRKNGEDSFPELDAYRAALQECNLPFNPERVWKLDELTDEVSPEAVETNQEQGSRAAAEVFAQNPPDGLMIDDDMMTRGALVQLSRRDIQVGRDFQIASHINRGSQTLHGYEADLTLLEIEPAAIVAAMFAMLETLMEGGTPEPATVLVAPHLRA